MGVIPAIVTGGRVALAATLLGTVPVSAATVQVVLDGRTLWERASMTRRDPPEHLELDVSGGDVLELRVRFGANGAMQDYFDWADAALVR